MAYLVRRSVITTVLLSCALAVFPLARGYAAMPAGHTQAMTSIRIASSTWTGYGPLYIAVQRGIFKKYGLNVSFQDVEAVADRFAALRANRLDGLASTVDVFTHQAARGAQVVQVFGIDHSVGGDGIVAKKSIKTVKDLKGKQVAVHTGSVSEFFLDYVLQKNGMSINDVNIVDMPDSGTAGSTFRAGRVDAAVTWEPWLSRAEKTSFGHVLVSSAAYPTIIVDTFGFRTDFARAHPAAVRNFIRAYFEAVTYYNTHRAAAAAIIGQFVHESPAAVQSDLSKVPLMDLAASKAYFGTAKKHGPIYTTIKLASDFWLRIKKIERAPDPSTLVDPTFQQSL